MAHDPAAPLVTWRGDAGRIELSRRTFGAAVVKAANLLDELEVGVGRRLAVDLGAHWQSAVWHAAALVCGATLVDSEPDVSLVPVGVAAGGLVVAVSLDPFGMPPREVPGGVVNGAAEVRGMPDQLAVLPTDGDVALDVAGGQVAYSQLGAMSASAAGELALSQSGAVGPVGLLGVGSPYERLLWHAVVPSVSGTAIVLGDSVTSQARAEERITATVTLVG